MEHLEPLWQPTQMEIDQTELTRFIKYLHDHLQIDIKDYNELHQWSIEHPIQFWSTLWDFLKIIGKKGSKVLDNQKDMINSKFFSEATLNFSEHCLQHLSEDPAIIYTLEGALKKKISFQSLYEQVAALSFELKKMGLTKGDRVAALMPNMPETVILLLACAVDGIIFSSASPDFGVDAVVDRFQQIKPKLLITVNHYIFKGKKFELCEKITKIQENIDSLEDCWILDYEKLHPFNDFIKNPRIDSKIVFTHVEFNHPLYILFSSGTTGKPKCIVHGTGNVLLQHLKEHRLHCNLKPNNTIAYFTTCGWMMWNWLVSALASKACIVLIDGSPFSPNEDILFKYCEDLKITHLGVSAKYLDSLRQLSFNAKQYTLNNLKMILSTGSPLSKETFQYVYDQIKNDLCLASISGGTDIVSCFALGNPNLPVYPGELQCKGLGMAVEIFNEAGNSVIQKKGELVCTKPFISQPIQFWNDLKKKKYQSAYFTKYPNIWFHGDYAEETSHGGLIILGRSDATLNAGGIRIGTAEIYRLVETITGVEECVAVGQPIKNGHDTRIILFVKLTKNSVLSIELKQEITDVLKERASPRHVPSVILEVGDIPKTRNGKITELTVLKLIQNKPIDNINALMNPECLADFKNRIEIDEKK